MKYRRGLRHTERLVAATSKSISAASALRAWANLRERTRRLRDVELLVYSRGLFRLLTRALAAWAVAVEAAGSARLLEARPDFCLSALFPSPCASCLACSVR